jgi:aspartate/methionine/tyrosine aminotransferase
VELLLTHSTGSTAEFTQLAGLQALLGDQTPSEEMVAAYQQRRDRIVSGLNSIPGVHCQTPKAAFYAFPNIKSYGIDSSTLARQILDEVGVALLPGVGFGANGEGYLRLAYANSLENIDRAIDRLSTFFAGLK